MTIHLGNGAAMSGAGAPSHSFIAASALSPEPLIRNRPAPEPLPLDHLGPLRAVSEAISGLTAAPIEIAFQSVLSAVSLAVQAHYDVELLHGSAPTSLFLLTIAASGERKSSCDRLALASIFDWEEAQAKAYIRASHQFKIDQAVYDEERRQLIKATCGSEAAADLAALTLPSLPISPRKILADITYEGVLRHFEDGSPAIGIFSDEGGQIFGGPGMSRDDLLKTSAGLSKIWDGAALDRTRAGAERQVFRHRRGALHLMIQPGIAESVLASEEMRDQGLLSRLLVSWPESRIGTRLIYDDEKQRRANLQAAQDLERFHSRIAALLERRPETGNSPLELAPRRLPLSPKARALLINFANQVETAQGWGEELSEITGFASKAAEQAARIAGVFTGFEDPEASEISETTMLDATLLMGWYLSEAQRLFGGGAADASLTLAQTALEWLQRKYPRAPFKKRDLMRFGPSAIRDTKRAEQVINTLHKHHHIRPGEAPNTWQLTAPKPECEQ